MLPAGLVAKAKVWEIPYAVEDADGAEQVLPAARSTFGMTNLGKTNNLLVFSFICYTSICALGDRQSQIGEEHHKRGQVS